MAAAATERCRVWPKTAAQDVKCVRAHCRGAGSSRHPAIFPVVFGKNCIVWAHGYPTVIRYLSYCQYPVIAKDCSNFSNHFLVSRCWRSFRAGVAFNGGSYLLTPWCRVPLEQLTGLNLVKKFPEFHGIRRFITALTSFGHLSLSRASPIQSIYPHPTSWRSVLILSTHLRLGLPSGLLPSGFPTKTLYIPLSSLIRATCPAHLILLDFINRTVKFGAT